MWLKIQGPLFANEVTVEGGRRDLCMKLLNNWSNV